MRQVLPPVPHDEVTALEALADPPVAADRPAVRVCMVQSIDGVAAIDGSSGPLGSPADRAFYLAARSLADVVLVGAETARAEGYGPARLTPQLVVARMERAQPPLPRIAIVSRSLRLDLSAPFFTDARARPIVITCAAAPADQRRQAARVADVIVAGDESVDMVRAVHALAVDGCRLIGAEGGPTLNAALATAGLMDELCLSIAPMLAAQGPHVIGHLDTPLAMALHKLFVDDGNVFMRLRPAAPRPDDAPAP